MSELRQILDLARLAQSRGEEVCLVTVVGVEGSSYRKPGARMLLTRGGQRAGTISGGCLEGEVSKKAWWLTAEGASIQRYTSFFDEDSGIAYGLGCGGTILLLLERGQPALATLEALRRTLEQEEPAVALISIAEQNPGTRCIASASGQVLFGNPALAPLAAQTLRNGTHTTLLPASEAGATLLFCERITPPPALWVFGAGDDAQPLVEFAHKLGWRITVADGRSHLARPERFPLARQVLTLTPGTPLPLEPADAAVLMTHSYEQDHALLARLLPLPLAYLGVLGPRRRTRHIVDQIIAQPGSQPGTLLGITADEAMARLHAPVGLGLPGHTPAAIALSIAAEIHSIFAAPAAPECAAPLAPAHAL
uniref:XdhC/CoxI family protein n=1 Tax=Acidobacterium capsulatum TaxID=33075 RepID=A0A7V5CSL5_9BACT